jgi:hypothetical protein
MSIVSKGGNTALLSASLGLLSFAEAFPSMLISSTYCLGVASLILGAIVVVAGNERFG